MDKFPVYIRFEPEDDDDRWCLNFVEVRVNPVGDSMTGTQDKKYETLRGPEILLWLGHGKGNIWLSPLSSLVLLGDVQD